MKEDHATQDISPGTVYGWYETKARTYLLDDKHEVRADITNQGEGIHLVRFGPPRSSNPAQPNRDFLGKDAAIDFVLSVFKLRAEDVKKVVLLK